jgi:pyruvate dehydrogenase E2 component (dihydrolipoamide acetyltransferase)
VSKETVRVPDIGGADAAEVVELLVAVGDDVELEQGLVVLESDKASLEIPSTVAGRVVELLAAEGAQLAEGDPVAVIESGAAEAGEGGSEPESDDGAGDGGEAGHAQAAQDSAGEKAASPEATADDAGDADAPASAAAVITVEVPDIGTEDAVDVVEVSVQVGDTVAEGDSLIVLESDKASMEVPATVAGVVRTLHVAEGQQVRQGDAVADIAAEGGQAVVPKSDADSGMEPRQPAGEAQGKTSGDGADGTAGGGSAGPADRGDDKPAPATAEAKPADGADAGAIYAGPAVRKLAREFGVTLASVRGSGPRGRILKEDLQDYVKRAIEAPPSSRTGAGLPQVPEVDFSAFGEVETVKRSKIDRLTADNMQRSWLNVPHVTQFDDVDITELEAFRQGMKAEGEKRGVKLTIVPILLKACAVALKQNEKLNASLSDGGETLTFKRYVHIGMAVDTPAGLVVPVIRDVDRKGLWELAEEVLDLAGRARERKLKPAEMQGAGFTISSLGAIGGRGFTPIVNTPEVGILGVGKAGMQPSWNGQAFEPRLQLPLSLSYDHRVVNGGDGGRFLTDLKALLEDLRRLLL